MFPEYLFGRDPVDFDALKKFTSSWEFPTNILLGTFVIKYKDTMINTALLIDLQHSYHLIGKQNPMHNERSRGVSGLKHPGELPFAKNVMDLNLKSGKVLRTGIIICSDIWQAPLIREIADQGAELLLIPAMTVTLPDHGDYAKIQWHALSLARSREFVLPIVVCDNPMKVENYETGQATVAVDPSVKHAKLQTLEDFLMLPSNGYLWASFDLEKIQAYREYRLEQGLKK